VPQGFVHLHTHSHYSLLSGACRIDEMVRAARDLGMSALALTDQGNLFGAVEFFEKAQEAGIRPILGCELYLANQTANETNGSTPEHGPESNGHDAPSALVVLARNDRGYRNLMKLSSLGYLEGRGAKPTISRAQLAQHAEGLIVLSGASNGEISRRLAKGQFDEARAAARWYRDLFGSDFYLELVDHGLPEHRLLISRLIDLAREIELPLAATNHVHYLAEHHADAHDALLCIQSGAQQSDESRFRFPTREMYLKTPEQMQDLFRGVEDAVSNTVRIAERCEVTLELGNLKLPHFPCPPEFPSLDHYLTHLCRIGMHERYSEITPALEERLTYELATIHKMGYSGYFLIVMDFIRYARSISVPVGPGRGSAAGSLVSYCLGITNIDPIQYQLLFERFLNPERVSMPDIDVDFSDRGRGRVIQYVVEKYGAENVCQIITFGTMAARAAVRDVGRVMGMPYAEVDQLAKTVPAEIGIKLSKALEQSPDLRTRYESDPRVRELIDTAQILEGLSRHASTHAAGVIITPSALTEYVPLYRSHEDEVTTQFDMNACDKIGLLKMDFLGLRTLTVLEDCQRHLRDRGIEVDLEVIPLDDPAAYALFAAGETIGIFQFESSGMTEYLRKLKPNAIEDLIAMNALYRPGPLGSGMVDDFILRKHGDKKIEYEHPLLEPILRDTYGVIVYQEQVMQIASAMSGYTLGEADILRRAMGKKKKEIMKQHRDTFIERAVQRKVPQRIAASTFDLMAHFAGYGFNKSHSAGYALVAYQTAYLKAHYPVEFMAAVLTSEMSNSDRVRLLLGEVRRMGITVLPPAVDASREGFTVEAGAIRFGLGAVKGVGHAAVAAICEARDAGGPFRDPYDLAERIEGAAVNRKCLEALIFSGALDVFGWHRARLFDALARITEWAARRRRERELGQQSLFGGAAAPAPQPAAEETPEWDPAELLTKEKSALGFYVSGHPMDRYRTILRYLGASEIAALAELAEGSTVEIAGLVAQSKKSVDRKGRPLAFVTLEDSAGTIECILFQEPLEAVKSALGGADPLLVNGRLSSRGGELPKLVASEAFPLLQRLASGRYSLHLAIESAWAQERLAALHDTLRSAPGPCAVYLHVDHRALGGVVMRCRSTRISLTTEVLERLEADLDPHRIRIVAGDSAGVRSAELFGGARAPAPVLQARAAG
jgi:DNA polymerase-3 subunit alpha